MPKMGEYVKTFKVKEEGNKLMRFRIDDEKLLEKYEAIWNKIDDLKNIKLNTLPVYDDIYKNQNKNMVIKLILTFTA